MGSVKHWKQENNILYPNFLAEIRSKESMLFLMFFEFQSFSTTNLAIKNLFMGSI